ncbi:MAG: phosphoglycolate phosphatase [Paenibacillus sp.]|jgi:phosphoglycolate phosphatase|nr:phosphoglycolate phosphatase [Paenibacillus sp.]
MNILWDFDGTLFNTYPAFTAIFQSMLGAEHAEQDILSHLKRSFSHAVKHYGMSDQQVRAMFAKEDRLHPSQTPPFPHVEDILKFAETNVIMTHNSRKHVLNTLRHYGWETYFQDMVCREDGFPRKPDPASYRYLHRKHRIDLVIGDREIDIVPAKSLGIRTCLFQNDAPGADFYLHTYMDFFKSVKTDFAG